MNDTAEFRTTPAQRRIAESASDQDRRNAQRDRLNWLLKTILPANRFYVDKLGTDSLQLDSLEALAQLPFTTKADLVEAGQGGFAGNLTWDVDRYQRFHRTSGTRGQPMIVLDTQQDWQWWMETWQPVLDSADLRSSDRVLMAFSFGPFIGFWSAFDAAVERGSLVVPSGAMSSLARLDLLDSIQATVVFCTPSYALHLAELAAAENMDLRATKVSRLIVAGEPGGSIPSIRNRIEEAWGATVVDHAGASEVGPWGYADREHRGLHVNEAQYIPEFIPVGGDPQDACLRPEVSEDAFYELVLTCLGRVGSPVLRYRTGDLVRPVWLGSDSADSNPECRFVLLDGGVRGRVDDMLIIRGVNVFPTSVEQILRGFPDVVEYRLTAYREGSMDQLKIDVELASGSTEPIARELQLRLGFRVEVAQTAAGSLPRFEAKGKRFVDQR